ncbi:anti-sigma factor [Rhodococcoides corynebacterioides]|uniref:Regulator of SigK n=1 Tax=Rhodococcoides corynebacterioides TaxID=53972 RepID=A0ABS7P1R3_9NOCA|nr:anti-sigma factor [Rhodococcus corynebacterioides]MBY6366317.1 anti-sigma factor [Rhodococcus corynebacterioides]MBY6406772.1 anti-sigma factor [Rhodococcus corynebacterioides]
MTASTPGDTESSDLVDLAYAYALDAVDDVERADIDRRVAAASPDVRARFDAVVESVHVTLALAADADASPPPAHLRERVLSAVDAEQAPDTEQALTTEQAVTTEQAGPAAPVVSLDDRRRTRRWRIAAAAAAAVLVVGVGGAVVSQQFGSDPTSPTATVLAADDVQRSTVPVEGGGSATVAWSRSHDAAVVTLDGLTDPGDGRVFEMWLIGADPAPRPAGLVEADAATADREHLVSGLEDATTWAVTVEPEGGSDAPTSQPIVAVTF